MPDDRLSGANFNLYSPGFISLLRSTFTTCPKMLYTVKVTFVLLVIEKEIFVEGLKGLG
jgi:hypothetical protein